MMQPKWRSFLEKYLSGVVPSICQKVAQQDRMQMHSAMKQVGGDRKVKAAMKKEPLDIRSYEAAIADFSAIAGQVPAPTLQLQVPKPVLAEEPPQETPVMVLDDDEESTEETKPEE
jgi:hypothetical protein